MSWQLHLTASTIRHVHLVNGTPDQVAVSDTRQRIQFYDRVSGAHYDDLNINPDLLDTDVPEERRLGLEDLKAPNGVYLPFVEFNSSHLYVSEDGKLRIIHDHDAGITLEIGMEIFLLDMVGGKTVKLVALDRTLGAIAALNEDNLLHIFQQQNLSAKIPLEDSDVLQIFIKMGGSELIIIEPNKLRLLNSVGKLIREKDVHYIIGPCALSPDGQYLLVADAEHQVLRLYNRDLIPIRQQHAIDLVTRANQLQLFADAPADAAPLVSMSIDNAGNLAFAMAGVVCISHIEDMTELPQPRLLL